MSTKFSYSFSRPVGQSITELIKNLSSAKQNAARLPRGGGGGTSLFFAPLELGDVGFCMLEKLELFLLTRQVGEKSK